MEIEDVMKALAQSCWGRPAINAEVMAMVGELERDVKAIATMPEGRQGALFNIEPVAFEHILQKEARR